MASSGLLALGPMQSHGTRSPEVLLVGLTDAVIGDGVAFEVLLDCAGKRKPVDVIDRCSVDDRDSAHLVKCRH